MIKAGAALTPPSAQTGLGAATSAPRMNFLHEYDDIWRKTICECSKFVTKLLE